MTVKKTRILAQSLRLLDDRHRRRVAAFAAVSVLGVVAAFAVVPESGSPQLQLQTVVERLDDARPVVLPAEQQSFLREERIQRGDTLAALFSRLGVNDREAFDFIRTDATAQAIARQLRPGRQVTARSGAAGELQSLYFPLNGGERAIVVKREGSRLVASEQPLALEARVEMRSGEIRHSLFGATDAADIPDAVAMQLAEIFSGDIDFHRDLRKGDRFSIVYEVLHLHGEAVRGGRILAAEFTNDGKTFEAYWHASSEAGKGGYYTADGKSLRKAFLRSPLEFSRITSGFSGNRFHPVLKKWRAHKGIDYGAPIGTRVRSVGDGIVDFAGKQGGYGNLVIVRHQGNYATAYGHLNGFAPGIRKGSRVAQGDIVGFVGKTGLASGPHLHYEFRIHGQQVNPLAVTLPPSVPLEAAQLPAFRSAQTALNAQLVQARDITGTVIE